MHSTYIVFSILNLVYFFLNCHTLMIVCSKSYISGLNMSMIFFLYNLLMFLLTIFSMYLLLKKICFNNNNKKTSLVQDEYRILLAKDW